ncbi:hypothetical protein DMH26_00200 [Streptomyces sp. WAC 05379]|uniref:DUF6879 family protein n=1 Tax=Streptomyces sp. WAC 05379 TaxID=2203207 RepID=UPI000F741294|nr:DUF6879 family protein [Streptomyces sp. WAC 05379]RSO09968.1 hypothetical protein DMH26_00200 [Streptomyces sp. WAC 05379]
MGEEPSTPESTPAGGRRRAPLVLRTLITVVVSTVAYGLIDLINLSQDTLEKLGVSIGVGCLTLIVQYMVVFERRLAMTETDQQTRARELHDHFHQLSENAGLLSGLDQAGMNAGDARRLIKSASLVGLQGPEILKAFARAEIESLASVITDLTGMTAHWQQDNNECLIRLTGCAQLTIDATSSSVDRPFWDTDPAEYYLDAQVEAMRDRAVTIRRLFMITADEESNPAFMLRLIELCEKQRDLGIKVRCIVVSPQQHTRVTARDIVIFDDALYVEFDPDFQQRNLRTRLDADGRRVNGQVRHFNELWQAATETGPR